jgi:hypothetical protein
MSEVTERKDNVFTALCKAQLEFGKVQKGSVNPAFKSKYADLADVASVVIPTLATHGIAVIHSFTEDGEKMRTLFVHGESDTHIFCDVPLIVDKRNMQGMKSAVTYAKRIGLESLSGVAPEDDDGAASTNLATKINEEQAQTLRNLIEESGRTEAKFLNWALPGIRNARIEDIPEGQFDICVTMLKKAKDQK